MLLTSLLALGSLGDGAAPAADLTHPQHEIEHIVCPMSFGGRVPADTQWFTLPRAPFSPFVAPFFVPFPIPAVIPGSVPYTTPPGGVSGVAGNNPAINGIRTHANTTRYWSGTPTFVVSIPPTVPALPGGQPNLATTVQATFPNPTIPATLTSTYTWQNWVTSVQATISKFTGVTTADCNITFGGAAYAPVNYTTLGAGANVMPPGVLAAGEFVWPSTFGAGATGPTGNGINEIILTDQVAMAGGLGLTSMLVDPNSGRIMEADVLLYVGATVPGGPPGLIRSNAAGTFLSSPDNWTALTHELGHALGLDHTNLHPGVAPPAFIANGGTSFNLPAGVATAACYTNSTIPFAGFPSGIPAIPAMVGFITYIQGAVNYSTMPLMPDDVASLSKIYPVLLPRQGSNRLPLINVTSRIEGRLGNSTTGIPPFGRNAWVVPEGYAGVSGFFPFNGTVVGASRITTSDPVPLIGTTPFVNPVSGANYFAGASVVGSAGCTGDFSIDGIYGGSFAAPATMEVVFEDGAPLGVTDGVNAPADNLAEWYTEPGFYVGNPLAGAPAYVPTIVRSAFGLTFGPAFSSMKVIPGTVIVMDPTWTDEAVLAAGTVIGPAQNNNATPVAVVASGVGLAPFGEARTRPLVDMQPRNGRFNAASLTITAQPTPTLALALPTAQLWVNGVNVSGLLPAPTFAGGTATWTIPMGTLTALVGGNPNSPINVSFVIADATAPQFQALGRNDVVL